MQQNIFHEIFCSPSGIKESALTRQEEQTITNKSKTFNSSYKRKKVNKPFLPTLLLNVSVPQHDVVMLKLNKEAEHQHGLPALPFGCWRWSPLCASNSANTERKAARESSNMLELTGKLVDSSCQKCVLWGKVHKTAGLKCACFSCMASFFQQRQVPSVASSPWDLLLGSIAGGRAVSAHLWGFRPPWCLVAV